MGIWDDVKYRYRAGSLLMRIIYINIGVFIVLRVLALLGMFSGFNAAAIVGWVETPSNLGLLLRRPWTVLTYMFAHYDFFHILFNMLWLYWLGRIFLEYFNQRQLCGLYILGGLGGVLLYLIGYNLLPVFAGQQGMLIGASASVLAIVIAMAVYAPDYPIGLLFIGQISLKWVAIITIVIMLLGSGEGQLGAQLAHLGGALVGVAFGFQIRRGHDITAWPNAAINSLMALFHNRPKRSKGPRVGNPVGGTAYHYQETKKEQQSTTSSSWPTDGPSEAEIDAILDKLKRSGYAALTDQEKATLFRASKKKPQ